MWSKASEELCKFCQKCQKGQNVKEGKKKWLKESMLLEKDAICLFTMQWDKISAAPKGRLLKNPLNLWSWSYLAGPTPPSFFRTVIVLGYFFCDLFWLIGWFRYVLKHILGIFEINFS